MKRTEQNVTNAYAIKSAVPQKLDDEARWPVDFVPDLVWAWRWRFFGPACSSTGPLVRHWQPPSNWLT